MVLIIGSSPRRGKRQQHISLSRAPSGTRMWPSIHRRISRWSRTSVPEDPPLARLSRSPAPFPAHAYTKTVSGCIRAHLGGAALEKTMSVTQLRARGASPQSSPPVPRVTADALLHKKLASRHWDDFRAEHLHAQDIE